MDPRLQQEAMRRRAGMPASPTGIPGGAPVVNATPAVPTPSQTPSFNPTSPTMPQSPQESLQQARPNEAMEIVKALKERLKKLPPDADVSANPSIPSTSAAGMGGGATVLPPTQPPAIKPIGAQIAEEAARQSIVPQY